MITATEIRTVQVIPWSDLPDIYRWSYSYGEDRVGRYIEIDGHLYNVRNCIYSRYSATNFGVVGWDYVFQNATGNGRILLRPTKGNVGKWPHEWTHVEIMTIPD